jgi:hypothetical protein
MKPDGGGRSCAVAALVTLAAMLHPTAARADSRVWLASLNYESAQLLVPVLVLRSTDDRGGESNIWLTGWTVGVERRIARDPRRRWLALARVTPVHAHGSNYIYRDGERDNAASYAAASIDLGGGIDVAHTRHWTGSYRALALYEYVGRPQTPEVRHFWDRPFVGLETVQSYARVRSDTKYGVRWDGVKADVSAQIYTGQRTWSRARASIGAGRRVGSVFLSGRAAAFAGRSLNVVSAFLVGGSWDLAPPDLLPGCRYAEFRVNRAATIGAGIDLRVHGAWEVGVRHAYLTAPHNRHGGTAFQTMTVWKGAVVNAGVALTSASPGRARSRAVLFATVTAAVIQH